MFISSCLGILAALWQMLTVARFPSISAISVPLYQFFQLESNTPTLPIVVFANIGSTATPPVLSVLSVQNVSNSSTLAAEPSRAVLDHQGTPPEHILELLLPSTYVANNRSSLFDLTINLRTTPTCIVDLYPPFWLASLQLHRDLVVFGEPGTIDIAESWRFGHGYLALDAIRSPSYYAPIFMAIADGVFDVAIAIVLGYRVYSLWVRKEDRRRRKLVSVDDSCVRNYSFASIQSHTIGTSTIVPLPAALPGSSSSLSIVASDSILDAFLSSTVRSNLQSGPKMDSFLDDTSSSSNEAKASWDCTLRVLEDASTSKGSSSPIEDTSHGSSSSVANSVGCVDAFAIPASQASELTLACNEGASEQFKNDPPTFSVLVGGVPLPATLDLSILGFPSPVIALDTSCEAASSDHGTTLCGSLYDDSTKLATLDASSSLAPLTRDMFNCSSCSVPHAGISRTTLNSAFESVDIALHTSLPDDDDVEELIRTGVIPHLPSPLMSTPARPLQPMNTRSPTSVPCSEMRADHGADIIDWRQAVLKDRASAASGRESPGHVGQNGLWSRTARPRLLSGADGSRWAKTRRTSWRDPQQDGRLPLPPWRP